ncbi:ABC transporter ATP-binding protein [Brevibacterium sp. 50QC2O2]|uniref:ABC transporter ATP-binding protein n=1 Tax=unclassified Brevibacterium TaxID=2614124 RepID=UPI00211C9AF7|nr:MULTISPECIES: ABC transporter ATP-binding protein [unclassified Brevibacterium]MCQ9369038.1 ABC transporter ATP-binding protein [Brevibacterium sp. 91QC2O2]MCQ9389799.1 ABC transporter ATP-binding protein [Brevibacterium sp. 50QC2O2]
MSVVTLRDLNLVVGQGKNENHILHDVSFTLEAGKITGVAGASGSGKTQTGMAIMGLSPAGARLSGSIDFEGRELVGLSPKAHNALRGTSLAMVFQDPSSAFHPMLSVGAQLTDHLRHHRKMGKREALARAVEILAKTRVPDPEGAVKKYPHQFSGGQLQRIAFASAVICEPRVLIADEPTTALDVTVQAGILRLLRDLCDDLELAVLLVTHDFGVLSSVADTIVVMQNGRVVETGDRHSVIVNPQHDYTRSLIESLPGTEVAG